MSDKFLIFLTVGTQLPFDRLVRTATDAASATSCELICQVGVGGAKPDGIECHEKLEKAEYEYFFHKADLILTHCGIGTIFNCLLSEKNFACMPRSAAFGEHRNDHQLHTAKKLKKEISIIHEPADIGRIISMAKHGTLPVVNNENLVNANFLTMLRSKVLLSIGGA